MSGGSRCCRIFAIVNIIELLPVTGRLSPKPSTHASDGNDEKKIMSFTKFTEYLHRIYRASRIAPVFRELTPSRADILRTYSVHLYYTSI